MNDKTTPLTDSKGAAIREKLVHILYGDWISYEAIKNGQVEETDTKKIDAILALLAQEVKRVRIEEINGALFQDELNRNGMEVYLENRLKAIRKAGLV